MPSNQTIFRAVTNQELERVLIVFVSLNGHRINDSEIEEMVRLVESAGGVAAGRITQRRNKPDAGYFVGRGKAEEIAAEASSQEITTIVVDHNLSPGQVNRLEETTGCKVIDRTELILAIFAVQARTPQARMRIELAQLRYMLPRLSGMWHHLDRLGAGIGTRGPGETQLEVDRRRARARISSLEKKLEKIEAAAKIRRNGRSGMYTVALAGYTNAGKSTLLNRLCDAGVRSEDRLFATLDTTSRRLRLPAGEVVLISDTVGFIENLPKALLESFRSTLDVVCEADLILLVADGADLDRTGKIGTVVQTLQDIDAGEVPRLLVWNKKDLPGAEVSSGLSVSALTGESIDHLLQSIQTERMSALDWWLLRLDICTGDTEYWIRSKGFVNDFNRDEQGGVVIHCGFYHGKEQVERYLSSRGISFSLEKSENRFQRKGMTDVH